MLAAVLISVLLITIAVSIVFVWVGVAKVNKRVKAHDAAIAKRLKRVGSSIKRHDSTVRKQLDRIQASAHPYIGLQLPRSPSPDVAKLVAVINSMFETLRGSVCQNQSMLRETISAMAASDVAGICADPGGGALDIDPALLRQMRDLQQLVCVDGAVDMEQFKHLLLNLLATVCTD